MSRSLSLSLLLGALALTPFLAPSAVAQADPGQCLVAGRLNDDGRWAPRFAGVQLLDARGRTIGLASRDEVARARQVRVSGPMLLSRCDGNGPLLQADGEPAAPKERVPAVSAGVLDIESVAFPKLRTGGALVELKVRVPTERVLMVMR